jgi:hypothetical protein
MRLEHDGSQEETINYSLSTMWAQQPSASAMLQIQRSAAKLA